MIHFTIHSVPVAQPRQRHAVRNGFVKNYTPTKHPVNAFKAAAQMAFKAVYTGPVLDGPVGLSIAFYMPRPKNMMWKTRPTPRAWHTKKPDLDNLEKALKDALTKLAWRDDSQVCLVTKRKVVGAGDDQPHAAVTITKLQEDDA